MNPTIIKRRSIRDYVNAPLSAVELETVKMIISDTQYLIPEQNIEIRLLDEEQFRGEAGGAFAVVAPYYLVIRAEKKDGWLVNAGCMGEEIVLKLTEMSLATCWIGGARYKSKTKTDGLDYVISIALGKTVEDFRNGEDEAKRAKFTDLVNGDVEPHRDVLTAARLAPSAINLQPVRYLCAGEKIHVYRKRSKNILGFLEKMQTVDCGIAMGNIRYESPEYRYAKETEPPRLSGCEYVGTLVREA
jgi:nitroreductase